MCFHKIRKAEVGLLLNVVLLLGTLATLFGGVYMAYAKPASWDQAVKDISEMRPKVDEHSRQLASINAQYADIKEELCAINRKLGR